MNKSIRVGLLHWSSFPAQKDFYPQDLPLDWQLSFYANEFQTACINLSEVPDIRSVLHWIDDLPEEFQLSFQLDHSTGLDFLAELVSAAGINLHTLLVPESEREILLQNFTKQTALSDAIIDNSVQVISSSAVWTPHRGDIISAFSVLPDIDDKRQYRQWIELWLDGNSQQELTLWLDGRTARYSTMCELRTLVELMGF